jgi:hypothetical protein
MSECVHGIEEAACAYCVPRILPGQVTDNVGELFDYAVSKPNGFTWADVVEDLEWSRPKVNMVIRQLRLVLGGDDINLVAEPSGRYQPWIYRLVGTYGEAREWLDNRIHDMESRLELIHSVASSVTRAADGRSVQGRKARKIERTVGYLLRELADIAA